MKTTLLALAMIFTFNTQAVAVTPNDITPEQQAQLIQVLNQLEPEVLESLLTEEAMNWYIEQFNRAGENSGRGYNVTNGRLDIAGDYNDPNAPTFN